MATPEFSISKGAMGWPNLMYKGGAIAMAWHGQGDTQGLSHADADVLRNKNAEFLKDRLNAHDEMKSVITNFMKLSGKAYRNDPNALLSALDAMLPRAQMAILTKNLEDM